MPKPPVDPSFFDKVNYVIEAWAMPCEAPWYIYVETMKPAALEAFITLITFGWDDVARGYFRPKDTGRRRSSKRRPGPLRRAARFPELGEILGGQLPGAEHAKEIKYSALGATLWKIDTDVQQVLFWWLVADVTADFAFNWTSVLYDTFWCRASSRGRFSYTTSTPHTFPGDAWWLVTYDDQDYDVGLPNWVVLFGNSGPTGCTVAATQNLRRRSALPPPSGAEIRVVQQGTDNVYAQSPFNPFAPADTGQAVISGVVPPNTRFQVQIRTSGTPFAIYEGGAIFGIAL